MAAAAIAVTTKTDVAATFEPNDLFASSGLTSR
jgi:hypothetical protein